MSPPCSAEAGLNTRQLLWLMLGQMAVNSAMAGQRVAAPLQALQNGQSTWSVGLLLSLFTVVPMLGAMATGRLADRLGYHRPMQLAVGLTMAGAALAWLACGLSEPWQFGLLCLASVSSGAGANVCGIATQHWGGRLAHTVTLRLRVFSWLAMAPALASAVGPLLAGLSIDLLGFRAAYGLMLLLPLLSLASMARVPAGAPIDVRAPAPSERSFKHLLATPGLKRLLAVNWLLSASWDMHSFAVPVLGHARHYNASTIAMVLSAFTLAVAAVRLVMPWFAQRVDEVRSLAGAMWVTAALFAVYPFATSPWWMACCAALLGLTLGLVQPTVVSALYQLAPPGRQGETIALRSMVISVSNSSMPLAFGALGASWGPAVLFWCMSGLVSAGSMATQGLRGALNKTAD